MTRSPVRWSAWVSCGLALAYGVAKIEMTRRGEVGMPGLPTSPSANDEIGNIPLRQAMAAAVGFAAAILALATIQAWGRHIPRPLILLSCGVGFFFIAPGAVIILLRTVGLADRIGEVPLTWTSLTVNALAITMTVAWLLMTVEYQRATRPRGLVGVDTVSGSERGSSPASTDPGPDDGDGAITAPRPSPRTVAWTGRVIVAWSAVFGALHLFWAVGFRPGLARFLSYEAAKDAEIIGNPWFIAFGLWGVAAASLIGGVIGLSLLRPWGSRAPRWLRLAPSLVAAGALGFRAVSGLISSPLYAIGAWRRPDGIDPDWIVLDAVLFAPWFLIGAIAFALASWSIWRRA